MDTGAGHALLLELLKEQRMLLFVGAGLSRDLGYPLWAKLLSELEKELSIDAPTTSNPLERAESVKRSFVDAGRLPDYYALIQQAFAPKPRSTA